MTIWHHSSINNIYLQVIDLNPAKRYVLLARLNIRRLETCLIMVIWRMKSPTLLTIFYSTHILSLNPPPFVYFYMLLWYPFPFRSIHTLLLKATTVTHILRESFESNLIKRIKSVKLCNVKLCNVKYQLNDSS